MPKDRDFIDKYAMRGRPRLAPDSELLLKAEPSSRSLKELSKFDAQSRRIVCEIKGTKLRLDLQHVIGDRIIINKKDSISFARWILKSYEVKNDRTQAKLDREDRNDV